MYPWIFLFALAVPATEAGPSRPTSERPLAELFTPADYPAGALRRGAEGRVSFRLHIGPDGALRDCEIVASSGDVDLDRATCKIVWERGRFRPGRDADGNPLGGTMPGRVAWNIENVSGGLPVAPTHRVTRLRESADGSATCSMTVDGALVWTAREDDCRPAGSAPAPPAGAASEVTLIEILLPEGIPEQPPAEGEAETGELILEWASRLTIAPGGHVAECRLVRRISFRPDLGASVPDHCSAYRRGEEPMFEPASDPGEMRFARIVTRLYQRDGDEH
jgi:TonB family protein